MGKPALRGLVNGQAEERMEAMWIIQAHRTAGSVFGAASRPLRDERGVRYFEEASEAQAEAKRLNDNAKTVNIFYTVLPAYEEPK